MKVTIQPGWVGMMRIFPSLRLLPASLCSLSSVPQRKLNYQRGAEELIYTTSNSRWSQDSQEASGESSLSSRWHWRVAGLHLRVRSRWQEKAGNPTFIMHENPPIFSPKPYILSFSPPWCRNHLSSAEPALSGDAALEVLEMDGAITQEKQESAHCCCREMLTPFLSSPQIIPAAL